MVPRILTFAPAPSLISEAVTKFGGQPCWLSGSQWPISRSLGKPMRFICQIALPPDLRAGGQQMAYLFMIDEAEAVDGSWEPDAGENALILQPGPFVPIVSTRPLKIGPTLQARRESTTGFLRRPQVTFENVELAVSERELEPTDSEPRLHSRIGGQPGWLQNDETPDGDWRFLAQIDSVTTSFAVDFGDGGVGYLFVRADGLEARFLWQSL